MNECSFSPRSIILGQMATACQPHIRIKVGPGDSRIDNLPLSKDCVIAAFGFSPGKFVLLPQLQNVQCDHNDCCCLDCEEQQSSERRDFLYVCFPNRGWHYFFPLSSFFLGGDITTSCFLQDGGSSDILHSTPLNCKAMPFQTSLMSKVGYPLVNYSKQVSIIIKLL